MDKIFESGEVLMAEDLNTINSEINELNDILTLTYNPLWVSQTVEMANDVATKIEYTIPAGIKVLNISGTDDQGKAITSITARTGQYDETYLTIKIGSVTDREINYVKTYGQKNYTLLIECEIDLPKIISLRDQIADINDLVGELGSDHYKEMRKIQQDEYSVGYQYCTDITSVPAVGSDTSGKYTKATQELYKTIKLKVKKNDRITYKGRSGGSYRSNVLLFVDNHNIVQFVTAGASNVIYEGTYICPSDGIIIYNSLDPASDENILYTLKYEEFVYGKLGAIQNTLLQIQNNGVQGIEPVKSLVGSDSHRLYVETLSDNDVLYATDFPRSNLFGDILTFRADISLQFNSIVVEFGNASSYGGRWIKIDNTNIEYWRHSTAADEATTGKLVKTVAHGLTLLEYIAVLVKVTDTLKAYVTISTDGGRYTNNSLLEDFPNPNGLRGIRCVGQTLNNCYLSLTNTKFRFPVWVFGASYENISGTSTWAYYLTQQDGYTNILFNGYPGRNSDTCMDDFKRALKYGTPKYVYWTMFGNGSAESMENRINELKEIAKEKGFDIILTLRKSTPIADHSAKTNIVLNSGCRYVNYAAAVMDPNGDDTTWRDGYLGSDQAHPSAKGARAIVSLIYVDFPEILQYGNNKY